MPLTEKMDGRIFEILNRLAKVEKDLNILQQRAHAVEFLLMLLIESISIVEVATAERPVTNLFYEMLNDAADKPNGNRAIAMLARILADSLKAKSNVTRKRRRSKKRNLHAANEKGAAIT